MKLINFYGPLSHIPQFILQPVTVNKFSTPGLNDDLAVFSLPVH